MFIAVYNKNNSFLFNKINIFCSSAIHFCLILFVLLLGKLENKNQEILPNIIKINTISEKATHNKIIIKKKQKVEQLVKKNSNLNNKNNINTIKRAKQEKDERITKKIEFKNKIKKNLNQKKNNIDINQRKAQKEKELKNLKNTEIEKNNVAGLTPTKKPNENKKQNKNILTENEEKVFLKYKENLKFLIQKKATENYPKVSIRRREQGNVELIFLLDKQGNIKNIQVGTKTNATERLIKASIKSLEQLSPYKKNKILEKKNNFSIIIIYKLN